LKRAYNKRLIENKNKIKLISPTTPSAVRKKEQHTTWLQRPTRSGRGSPCLILKLLHHLQILKPTFAFSSSFHSLLQCLSSPKLSANPITIASVHPLPSLLTMVLPISVLGTLSNPNFIYIIQNPYFFTYLCSLSLFFKFFHHGLLILTFKIVSFWWIFRWAGETEPRVVFRNIVQRPRHKTTGIIMFLFFTMLLILLHLNYCVIFVVHSVFV
jgi:hypothetical protein